MHYVDAREKARWKLPQNASSYFEHILEVTSHETTAVQPLTSPLKKHPSPTFARPCEGVLRSTLLMSSSLLLQKCPTCLVRLTLIVFVMGGRCIHLPQPCILDRSLIQSMRQSGLFSDWLVFKLAWSSIIRLPKTATLWQNSGSHCFSPSSWVAADDNLAVGLSVQRLYGLSFWSSYHLCPCPIGRCVSHD